MPAERPLRLRKIRKGVDERGVSARGLGLFSTRAVSIRCRHAISRDGCAGRGRTRRGCDPRSWPGTSRCPGRGWQRWRAPWVSVRALARAPSTATPGASAEQGTNVKTKTNAGRSPRRTRGKTSEASPAVSPRRSNGLANPKITGHALGGKKKTRSSVRPIFARGGWARGAAREDVVAGWYYTCVHDSAPETRVERAPVPPPRVPLVRSFASEADARPSKSIAIRSAKKKKKRFGARTASGQRFASTARAATRAREQKDRNVRVGRLRPRTFSILSATTFWFALATVSRPIPFQSNAHSCLFACLWVAQKVYSHRHLNPVSPTRLLHAKHLPWFSCTGAAGAAGGGSLRRGGRRRRRRRAVREGHRRVGLLRPGGGRRLLRLELLHQVAPGGAGDDAGSAAACFLLVCDL